MGELHAVERKRERERERERERMIDQSVEFSQGKSTDDNG
jgi:hypothetical protein